MKRSALILLLLGIFASPLLQAESSYGGILIGQIEADDIDTGNLGLMGGITASNGFGVEAFYASTVAKDSDSFAGFELETSIDAYGLLGTYQTSGDTYVKFKAGLAIVQIEFDLENASGEDDDESGLAFGLGAGTKIGNGVIELNYLVLPEFEDFRNTSDDAEVDMISLSYLWNF